MRMEEHVLGIESGDGFDVRDGPGARPHVGPSLRGGQGVYFATSIARDSRMTMTFT